MDGFIDTADFECVSPCDDREDSFATGVPGDNVDACKQDCFFDGNSGSGDDKCLWNLKCCEDGEEIVEECACNPGLIGGPQCPDEQSADCINNCQGVPQGCDCFGCCTVTVDDVQYDIFLGDDCSFANIEECDPCEKQESCENECDPDDCELCFGEDPDDLPEHCTEPECPGGLQPCDPANPMCPADHFCFAGNNCCYPDPG